MAKREHHEHDFEEALFTWETPEFLRFERGKLWVLSLTLLLGLLLTYAYLQKDWSFMVILLILPFTLFLEHRRKPKQVHVIFSEHGVKFGQFEAKYTELKGFWILHQPPVMDELHLKTGHFWHSEVAIPLSGINPTLLRQYLMTQIPEFENKKPGFLDLCTRILRLR